MNILFMCSKKLTQSQYAHHLAVRTFAGLIPYHNEGGSTHLSRILLYSAHIEAVAFEVHRYITTLLLPFNEFSKDGLWTDEADW